VAPQRLLASVHWLVLPVARATGGWLRWLHPGIRSSNEPMSLSFCSARSYRMPITAHAFCKGAM
jgi:hypothetical protein